jgi:hypothetical protein
MSHYITDYIELQSKSLLGASRPNLITNSVNIYVIFLAMKGNMHTQLQPNLFSSVVPQEANDISHITCRIF